ncbi:MAG: NAD-dependent epimerase/dehydratase family protein [Candidatus Eisenbacteria bacterium]|nr:NAD-dependent epimerase/dehydratase family protein [Candidatus Eisenbacteria bacterium]
MKGRALVTGAAGFVGSHVVEMLLASGAEVVGVDAFTDAYDPRMKEENLREARSAAGFRLVREDLNAIDLNRLLEGIDVVFHLAAQAGVRASWGRDFERYVNANILATQRLLEAAREQPIRRFVFASSSSVYGETDRLPVREDAPKRPHSPYGVTKLAAENLGHLYRRNHGVPFVALRYFTVIGPRQRPDMAPYRLVEAAFGGEPFPIFGTGEQTRDFTFVEDAARATIRAGERETESGVFNIGGGARITLNEAIRLVEESAGRAVARRSADWQKGDVRDTWADCAAAARELEFGASVSVKEAIERLVRWYRKNRMHER